VHSVSSTGGSSYDIRSQATMIISGHALHEREKCGPINTIYLAKRMAVWM